MLSASGLLTCRRSIGLPSLSSRTGSNQRLPTRTQKPEKSGTPVAEGAGVVGAAGAVAQDRARPMLQERFSPLAPHYWFAAQPDNTGTCEVSCATCRTLFLAVKIP